MRIGGSLIFNTNEFLMGAKKIYLFKPAANGEVLFLSLLRKQEPMDACAGITWLVDEYISSPQGRKL